MADFIVFAAFLVFRVLSVFVVKTWFVPDEYWQSLEVAHHWTFGYGHLTWEWSKGIRSYVHPLSIAALYEALAYFGLDQVDFLILAPRIVQALLSAFTDYSFYRWSNNSKWSLFLILTSWFWFYTATRTLINTVETCLTVIALRFYPRHYEADTYKFLWIASFLIAIRPTSAILWFPLCMIHIRNHIRSAGDFIKAYVLIPVFVGAIVVAIDSYAYGRFIVTPFEFFKVNVLENIGTFYGQHPWYWYITTGLPTILSFTIFPFLFAAFETLHHRDVYAERYILLIAILFTLGIYSCLPHKEFRFILPLLPLCLYITGDSLKTWSRNASRIAIWILALALLVFNAVPSVYLSWIHQRGATDIMTPIEQIAREYRTPEGQRAKFLFLMPCHSTPLYSHVHQNVSLRFLTCEPNLSGEKNYVDEADQFYANPAAWLRSHVPVYPKSALPTHTVLFDTLQPKIGDFLKSYKLIHNVSHSDYIDSRIGYNVLLFERTADAPATKTTERPNRFNQEDELDNAPKRNEL